MFFQPCSWIEQDINYKYTIDTYGRTHEGDIARVRLLNFKPYFYMKFENNDTQSNIQSLIKSPQGKQIDTKITLENKLDVINGFNNLLSIKVWKLEFSSLWAFKYVSKLFKNRSLYESNIPPYLRLFHELDISPSSTIELKNYKEVEDSSIRVDKLYEVSYKNIRSELSKQIPLLILSYDIEVYSDSGQFPMSLNPKDEIIQIGLSIRWTDSLLDSVERYVLVSGTSTQSNTNDLKIIEINPRSASQLVNLYERVDGYNPYDVLFALAVGETPVIKKGEGPFQTAASFVFRHFQKPQRQKKLSIHAV